MDLTPMSFTGNFDILQVYVYVIDISIVYVDKIDFFRHIILK